MRPYDLSIYEEGLKFKGRTYTEGYDGRDALFEFEVKSDFDFNLEKMSEKPYVNPQLIGKDFELMFTNGARIVKKSERKGSRYENTFAFYNENNIQLWRFFLKRYSDEYKNPLKLKDGSYLFTNTKVGTVDTQLVQILQDGTRKILKTFKQGKHGIRYGFVQYRLASNGDILLFYTHVSLKTL